MGKRYRTNPWRLVKSGQFNIECIALSTSNNALILSPAGVVVNTNGEEIQDDRAQTQAVTTSLASAFHVSKH